tara:strand:+ start:79 stop:567 length:489 start_codon:yes stop_codon:yes gene_type:complete
MCLTERTYNPAEHLLHLCKKVVKKIPIYLEHYDDNRDCLAESEGTYLKVMNAFKKFYDDCVVIPTWCVSDRILCEKTKEMVYDYIRHLELSLDLFGRLHQENLDRVYLYTTYPEEMGDIEAEIVTINGVEYLHDPRTDDIFDLKEYDLTGDAIILGKYADLK